MVGQVGRKGIAPLGKATCPPREYRVSLSIVHPHPSGIGDVGYPSHAFDPPPQPSQVVQPGLGKVHTRSSHKAEALLGFPGVPGLRGQPGGQGRGRVQRFPSGNIQRGPTPDGEDVLPHQRSHQGKTGPLRDCHVPSSNTNSNRKRASWVTCNRPTVGGAGPLPKGGVVGEPGLNTHRP